MGIPHHYYVRYIADSRMPEGHDWIYLAGEPPSLLLRVGADVRRALFEVAEMLTAGGDVGAIACPPWVA